MDMYIQSRTGRHQYDHDTSSPRGFTLIEVIAILIILGVLAAVVAARFQGQSAYTLQSETDKIRERLRFAHILAMNADAAWGIQLQNNSYQLFSNANSTNLVPFPGESTSTVTLPDGISLTPATIISFNSMGQPCSDVSASALRTSDMTITVSDGSNTAAITITKNTGYIQ
jgi:MSHA pilin protein MshC